MHKDVAPQPHGNNGEQMLSASSSPLPARGGPRPQSVDGAGPRHALALACRLEPVEQLLGVGLGEFAHVLGGLNGGAS